MAETVQTETTTMEQMVKDVIATIEREREREIIERRFGLLIEKKHSNRSVNYLALLGNASDSLKNQLSSS